MTCFINFSNHATAKWPKEQIAEANKYGEIIDIPFPDVPPLYNSSDIAKLAQKCVNTILQKNPSAVMCQGEFTLCYAVVNLLKSKEITTLAACSERKVIEEPDGKKITYFKFEQFREY